MKNAYRILIRKRKRFVISVLSFALFFYFMLPISLTLFPEQMNQTSFIPGVSWAWIYAFLQIIMIWLFGWIYHHKMKEIDKQTEQ